MQQGIMLFDVHYPVNIDLNKVNLPKDNDFIILGGDILDMKYLHGLDGMSAGNFNPDDLDKDLNWFNKFINSIDKLCKNDTKRIFIEGNHEFRLTRWCQRYPNFNRDLKRYRDCIMSRVDKYVPYGVPGAYYQLGDTVIIHGDYWCDLHAKKHLQAYGRKIIYGHSHDYQVYSDRTHCINKYSKFAMSSGCLCTKSPDWKGNMPNRWTNGFVSFVLNKGILIPTYNPLEKGINF